MLNAIKNLGCRARMRSDKVFEVGDLVARSKMNLAQGSEGK
jgi:hypothetical protein